MINEYNKKEIGMADEAGEFVPGKRVKHRIDGREGIIKKDTIEVCATGQVLVHFDEEDGVSIVPITKLAIIYE